MRVTTRSRYAIRAPYDLSFHRLGPAAGAKEIADRQKVPLRFLEQILQDLRKARIIEARRGPRGGYALARPPAKITLAEVLDAVRGPLEEMFGFEAPAAGADDVPAAETQRTAQVYAERNGQHLGQYSSGETRLESTESRQSHSENAGSEGRSQVIALSRNSESRQVLAAPGLKHPLGESNPCLRTEKCLATLKGQRVRRPKLKVAKPLQPLSLIDLSRASGRFLDGLEGKWRGSRCHARL